MTQVDSTQFEYQTADCWAEAVELLTLWEGEAKILAGGQSLVPMLNLRLAAPAALIDINAIPSQDIHLDDTELVIPAMTRHVDVLTSPLVREHFPLLRQAIGLVGNVRVRNRGTFGGSLAHADPTGEIPCVVLAAGGRIVIRGPHGTRSVGAADFFRTYLTTAVTEDEVITEVRLPVARAWHGWGFAEKVGRFSDFATVEVAALIRRDHGSAAITSASVVLGGVADRPLALTEDMVGALVGGAGEVNAIRAVANAAAEHISPESDVHASAGYRRQLTRVLTRRALENAVSTIDSEESG